MEKFVNIAPEKSVKNGGAEAEIFITVPKEVENFKVLRAPIMFFEGKIPKSWYGVKFQNQRLNTTWTYENVDLSKIKLVDKLDTEGYQYIELSNSRIILTHINNNVAKQFALPTTVDNKQVVAYNFVYGLTGDFDLKKNFVNDLGRDLFDEYSILNAKIKAKVEDSQKWLYEELANEPAEKYSQGILGDYYNTYEKQKHQQNLAQTKTAKPHFNWRAFWTSIWSGVSVGIVVGIPLWLIIGMINSKMNFGKAFIWFLTVPIAVSIVIGLILAAKGYAEEKRKIADRKSFLELNSSFTPTDMFKNVYNRFQAVEPSLCYNAVCEVEAALRSSRLRVIQSERRQSKAAADNAMYELNDLVKNGTKEEQLRREINSKIDKLNDTIRENNKNASYDVFDSDGNKIGRIDKK